MPNAMMLLPNKIVSLEYSASPKNCTDAISLLTLAKESEYWEINDNAIHIPKISGPRFLATMIEIAIAKQYTKASLVKTDNTELKKVI